MSGQVAADGNDPRPGFDGSHSAGPASRRRHLRVATLLTLAGERLSHLRRTPAGGTAPYSSATMTWTRVRQWGGEHPDAVDVVAAAALLCLGVLSVQVTHDVVAQMGLDAPTRPSVWTWTAYVVLVGGLAVRRRYPLTVGMVGGAAFAAFQALGGIEGTVSTVAVFLAIHAAGAYGRRRARDVVRGVVVLGLMGTLVWQLANGDGFPPGTSVLLARLFSVGLNVFFFGAAWVFGDLTRIRARREEQLAARTAELEVARERNAARAVVEERVRIARELHDVLAHHVSVMGVQAGAARHQLARAPERAAEPLAAIEASARSAVLELQRMLGFLRSDDDPETGDRSPQPGLGQLQRLAEDMRRAGVGVDLQVSGDVDELPDTIHLSAYRIVQEALTNVLKHAGAGTRATVEVARVPHHVAVEVADDGPGPGFADQQPGTGSGLVGMRERVALHGGAFIAGPATGGGFRVRAVLPLAGGSRDAPTGDRTDVWEPVP